MTEALRARVVRTFRSFHVRNYRLYAIGQIVSLVGTWMQSVAQVWLVVKLTDASPLALGWVSAFQFAPVLLLGPWGGLIADRRDKRTILIGTQAAQAVLALALGVLDATGAVRLWMVDVLALGLGLVTVLDNPTRQSFVTEMVGPEDTLNAVSLNSATFTSARIVGPAVAALVIKLGGLDIAFFANAASFLAVIVALMMMRPNELFRRAPAARRAGQIREGFRYVWSSPVLRRTLLLVTVIFTLTFNFSVLMPVIAKSVFHGGAGTYALLLSVFGAGSLVGALVMAGHARPTERLIAGAGLAFGALVALAGVAPSILTEVLVWVAVGLASMALMASTNSLLQLSSADTMRGRVMALYAVVFLGSTPIGSPLTGWAAERIGPRATLLLAGAVAVLASAVALWVARRRHAVEPPVREGRAGAVAAGAIEVPEAAETVLGA